MQRIVIIGVVLACLLAGVVCGPAWAQDGSTGGRDMEFEQQVYERLEQIDPRAVPLFQAATAALDADDLAAAQQGFEAVLELAPDFPDALRRLSYVYAYMNELGKAEELARRALELDRSVENLAGLARVLLYKETPKDNQEALDLAREATSRDPNDSYAQQVLLDAAAMMNELELMLQASQALVRLEPEDPLAHYFYGLVLADNEQWEQAEAELLRSQELGMPAEDVQGVLDEGIATQAAIWRGLRYGLYALGGWAVLLGLLFLAGGVLSRLTLAAVSRGQGLTGAEIRPAERAMRRVYRTVIGLTSLFFYLSIPVLLLSVIIPTALMFYLFFAIGQIPIKLAVIVVVAALYTLYAVLRSLFTRVKIEDPGRELARQESPYLWRALEDVARKLGTRPVDRVFLTPGTGISVYERGGAWKRMRGQGERCLVLGLGVLTGMSQGQFRAILAHEYGHFSHADTAGGDLAWQVRATMFQMAERMALAGVASWLNPAWLFLNGYFKIFQRITQGASRLQEILADRLAAVAYGVDNLLGGLEFVVRRDLAFERQTSMEIQRAQSEQTGLNNLYTLPEVTNCEELEKAYQELLARRTSPYDSHPGMQERMALIRQSRSSSLGELDSRPVWDLLDRPEDLQKILTLDVEGALRVKQVLE